MAPVITAKIPFVRLVEQRIDTLIHCNDSTAKIIVRP